jgi:MFS family permease
VVIALGVTWVLDGLEVTLVGAVAGALVRPDTLALTEQQVGQSATAYLAGAILGALVFGRLTDLVGRKRLFLVTLSVYLVATLLSALSTGFLTFALFRALTGAGIGGEYAAINSAIDELLPARVRGRADLVINGTYWLGTALGALSTLVLLDPSVLPPWLGWRVCFGLGALLGVSILLVRRHVPESPRWLLLHGHRDRAERLVRTIEEEITGRHGPLASPERTVQFHAGAGLDYRTIARILFRRHRRRALLGLTLMVAQAFAYNAVFFTYGLVLGKFYGIPAERIGLYLLPFALGNLAGPLLLGHLFDTIGRRRMIALTTRRRACCCSPPGLRSPGMAHRGDADRSLVRGVLLRLAGGERRLPHRLRALPGGDAGLAIALFYAVGTAAGGLLAPALFGALIASGSRVQVSLGDALGAGLMLAAAAVAALLCVPAERRSLEELDTLPDLIDS